MLLNVQTPWDKKTHRDSQVITASQLSDFADALERGTYNNSLISKLFVVAEDLTYTLNTRVLAVAVVFTGCGLVLVKDAAYEQ